ncbi:helix-turn-helix domain-containing protein [Micromonospora terminaliae]|uniref:helix-turn-helix domain-containing protein n=1 Tax=Micromonospora terminaliae TaxID=1914461 RepID=UPI00142EC6AE|nr:AraC family transcriptional regulator [Micromonospora terminaliae]
MVDVGSLGRESRQVTTEEAVGLRFEHRDTEIDVSLVDRVWRTRSDSAETMTSAARTCWQLILSRTQGRLHAGLRGPETRATTAPVPPDTEFLGVRFAFGAVLRPHPAASVVDGYVPFPVTESGRIVIGGEEWEAPTFENVEHFVRRLQDAGLLGRSPLGDGEQVTGRSGAGPTERTLQRRYRAVTGLSRTAVRQIDRANAAATMLRDGLDWHPVVETLGYFDQAHLARALRRYVGCTARELQADGFAAMSFLYKTHPGPGS